MKFLLNTLISVLFLSFVFAQTGKHDYDDELQHQNKAINALNEEIQQLRSKINKAETREHSTVKRISDLDQEISLTEKLIQALKKEEEKTREEEEDKEE